MTRTKAPRALRPAPRRKLEALEVEARRDYAADQRPFSETLCRLPGVSRHDRLRAFARGKVGPERYALDGAVHVGRDLEPERRSGVIMPGLDRIDPVPVRALAACEQEIDRGGCRACAVHYSGVAKRLAKMPALGVRLEVEEADDIGGGWHDASESREQVQRRSAIP